MATAIWLTGFIPMATWTYATSALVIAFLSMSIPLQSGFQRLKQFNRNNKRKGEKMNKNLKPGKDEAINNALTWTEGVSFSDGNMVCGISSTHVAIAFNNTPLAENQLTVLEMESAKALFSILYPAGRAAGFIL